MASNTHGITHFELIQIHMPYVSGVCTPPPGSGFAEGFHTPLTCVESSNATWAYTFGDISTPIGFKVEDYANGGILNRAIRLCIKEKSLSVTAPKIKPEAGMGSRGSMKVTFTDFKGDPGPITKVEEGTYFSKLVARNIFNNRPVYLIKGKIEGGITSIVSTESYLSDSLARDATGGYLLSCKSYLERTYKETTQFPEPTNARLRVDVNETTTTIPVFGSDYPYAPFDVIRIGDELLVVVSVNGSGNSQTLTVSTRGSSISASGVLLSETIAESHEEGDDIQVCHIADQIEIYDLLYEILTSSGVPPSYINLSEWAEEIDDYWKDILISDVYSEPVSGKELVDKICGGYMIDLWEDPEQKKIRLSAVSVWKDSSLTIEEGRGITADTLKSSSKPDLRASRCYIYYDKRNKTNNDDRGNFKKLSFSANTSYESIDFYGSKKEVEVPASTNHTVVSSALRTQRQVARFSVIPRAYQWMAEEKYINYKTGDVVEFSDKFITDAAGAPSQVRTQITKIQGKYGNIGRMYSVEALTYLSAIDDSSGAPVFVLNGDVFDLNLWVHAGGPPDAVDVIFLFDGSRHGSSSDGIPAVQAGSFAAGSTITIVQQNGSSWFAKGGDTGDVYFSDNQSSPLQPVATAQDSNDGSDCYLSEGIETVIYTAGTYVGPDSTIYNADGKIYAPGGGGGGASGWVLNFDAAAALATGGGGAGFDGGDSGDSLIGYASPLTQIKRSNGVDGNVLSPGSGRTVLSLNGRGTSSVEVVSGAGGGYGQPGASATVDFDNPFLQIDAIGDPGIAGGAIRGSNVTVYTDGTTNTIISGNSSAFTEIVV